MHPEQARTASTGAHRERYLCWARPLPILRAPRRSSAGGLRLGHVGIRGDKCCEWHDDGRSALSGDRSPTLLAVPRQIAIRVASSRDCVENECPNRMA
jgi:hypothetical protein